MGRPVFAGRVLEGKAALVTGGGSGINLAIAERLAEHGARVTLVGRSEERLAGAVRKIAEAGGVAVGAAADVRDPAALERAFQTALSAHGPLDVLVCGAAGNFPAPAVGLSPNGFKAVVDIDLLGTFNACRNAFEHLRRPGACVLNISAPQAFCPTPFQAHVCAAKAGVDMLTRTLAIEWGGAGVRVNALTPGPVEDTEGMRRLAPSPEARERALAGVPLGRFADKGEIADVALFLCSDAARYITGAVVVCDGGQSLLGSGLLGQALGAL
jgi:NAD(P)-dependent dehydrogenase (short-subunit alcohol dehydrogenase family)